MSKYYKLTSKDGRTISSGTKGYNFARATAAAWLYLGRAAGYITITRAEHNRPRMLKRRAAIKVVGIK